MAETEGLGEQLGGGQFSYAHEKNKTKKGLVTGGAGIWDCPCAHAAGQAPEGSGYRSHPPPPEPARAPLALPVRGIPNPAPLPTPAESTAGLWEATQPCGVRRSLATNVALGEPLPPLQLPATARRAPVRAGVSAVAAMGVCGARRPGSSERCVTQPAATQPVVPSVPRLQPDTPAPGHLGEGKGGRGDGKC